MGAVASQRRTARPEFRIIPYPRVFPELRPSYALNRCDSGVHKRLPVTYVTGRFTYVTPAVVNGPGSTRRYAADIRNQGRRILMRHLVIATVASVGALWPVGTLAEGVRPPSARSSRWQKSSGRQASARHAAKAFARQASARHAGRYSPAQRPLVTLADSSPAPSVRSSRWQISARQASARHTGRYSPAKRPLVTLADIRPAQRPLVTLADIRPAQRPLVTLADIRPAQRPLVAIA